MDERIYDDFSFKGFSFVNFVDSTEELLLKIDKICFALEIVQKVFFLKITAIQTGILCIEMLLCLERREN